MSKHNRERRAFLTQARMAARYPGIPALTPAQIKRLGKGAKRALAGGSIPDPIPDPTPGIDPLAGELSGLPPSVGVRVRAGKIRMRRAEK